MLIAYNEETTSLPNSAVMEAPENPFFKILQLSITSSLVFLFILFCFAYPLHLKI